MKDSSPTLYVAYGLFATASLLIVVNMVPSLNAVSYTHLDVYKRQQ